MFALSPLTAKRLKSFRRNKRALFSFWALAAVFAVSLVSELICNSRPYWVRFRGRSFFPAFNSRTTYSGIGLSAEEAGGEWRLDEPVNWKAFVKTPVWKADESASSLWAPFEFSPDEVVDSEDLSFACKVRAVVRPQVRVARCDILPSGEFVRGEGMFLSPEGGGGFVPEGARTLEAISPPAEFAATVKEAFARSLPEPGGREVSGMLQNGEGWTARIRNARGEGAGYVPATFRQNAPADAPFEIVFALENGKPQCTDPEALARLEPASAAQLEKAAAELFARASEHGGAVSSTTVNWGRGGFADVEMGFVYATFPFPPCAGHPFGLDASGRDVFALVLYGTRIALSFGLILAFSGMFIGLAIGAVEGYFGGKTDIAGQRITEVWSAIPFLYVMIFVGSTLGRSFTILLVCYSLFNWIIVSYYMRAEFLRLRSRTFVEAARCQGLSHARVIFGHILPNALTPLVTLFPFLLMGAVGSLSVLDFLGFGLPAFTPSWGDLVSQGQQFRTAWWLILFPSAALFIVMLLTVLVGEGLRDAFDPRQRSKLE